MSKKSIGSRTLKAGAALLAVGAGVAAINAKNKNGTEKKEIKEIQKKEYEQYRNTERGKNDKNSKGIYYSMVIMKHLQDQKSQRALMLSQHIL